MKRKALYSRAARPRSGAPEDGGAVNHNLDDPYAQDETLGLELRQAAHRFAIRHERAVLATAIIVIVVSLFGIYLLANPQAPALTQWDIDNAVKYALEHTPPAPSEAAVAANIIGPSVVRVDGYLSPERAAQLAKAEQGADQKAKPLHRLPAKPVAPEAKDSDKDEPHPDSTGSGVVIDDKGDIMTNLHVISSTDRWVVTFADGSTSDAVVVSVQPENDLAVIRAKHTPNELKPATLASTRDLNPGDMVTAVGFPFGIGPSVSSGVVSGLKREFVDEESKKGKLTNLIQFDAAVNPGNSGGPLVNRDGEVVGIVTAIYNPTGQRVFAGLGFAVPIENAAKAVGENPL